MNKGDFIHAAFKAAVLSANCRVGKSYPVQCKNKGICKPIEGSFCTECESCAKFG